MRRPPTPLLVTCLLLVLAGCRRGAHDAPRISEFAAVQNYTLVGPLIPIGLPFGDEWVRLELRLEDARLASGTLELRRDDGWQRFGVLAGGWDGSVMTVVAEDGRGNAARFELAFASDSARGMAFIFWQQRGETVRYGADLGYE